MGTSKLTMLETTTELAADEVLARAKSFFATRPVAVLHLHRQGRPRLRVVSRTGRRGDRDRRERGPQGRGTRVTGSSYLFDMQVARFFVTLEPAGVP